MIFASKYNPKALCLQRGLWKGQKVSDTYSEIQSSVDYSIGLNKNFRNSSGKTGLKIANLSSRTKLNYMGWNWLGLKWF